MRREDRVLDVKASVAAGAPLTVGTFVHKWLQISGAFVATIVIEGRMKTSDWEVVDTVTAPSTVEIEPLYAEIRCNTTSFTSGAPVAELGALDAITS